MTPTEWTHVALGDVATITKGLSYKGEWIDKPGPKLIGLGEVEPGGGSKLEGIRTYGGEFRPRHVACPGDLLVALTDVTQTGIVLGSPLIVPPIVGEECLYTHHMGRISINDPNVVDPRFLYYRLRTTDFADFAFGYATGTTVRALRPQEAGRFELDLPCLHEQQGIAARLSALDDKIDLNRRVSETLESIARALFKSWFVDFDPVSAKAEGRPSGLPPHLDALFPDSFEPSELGEIPSGWRIRPIGAVVSVFGGSTPSTKEPRFWGGRHGFATPRDLSQLASLVLLNTDRLITDEGLAKIGSGLLPEGAVLMSSRAPVGYLAITRLPVAVNQGIAAMVCDKGLNAPFIINWAAAAMDEIQSRASGSTFAEISKSQFREVPCLVPPQAVHQAYDSLAGPVYDLLATKTRESASLAALRDALLPKLISGELRVPQAERLAEAAL